MAVVHLYGPYYVIESAETKFKPGEARRYGFGPWNFSKGTVTVSVGIGDYSAVTIGTRRITIEDIEYEMGRGGDNIYFTYRNTGEEEIQAWYFNLTFIEP